MKILVTGSNGFVGGNFGRFAAGAGHEILGVARASQPSPDWPGGYAQADVLTSDLAELIREFTPDVLLHAAGTASVAASIKTPLDDLRASVLTWANILDAVRRSGCETQVFFPSSAAVYGNVTEFPVHEDAPVMPISPYGYHKAGCELLAREYARCFGLNITVCRIFSLFGHAQRRLLIWELYNQFTNNTNSVWIEGLGTETRDYLHIDDASAAMLLLAESRLRDAGGDRLLTVNIASGEETSVLDLARQIDSLIASAKEIKCRGIERAGDPRAWRADISLLKSLAPSWRSRPLSQSLAQCVAVWQQNA